MQRLRTFTSLDESAVAGHPEMPAAHLFKKLEHWSQVMLHGKFENCRPSGFIVKGRIDMIIAHYGPSGQVS